MGYIILIVFAGFIIWTDDDYTPKQFLPDPPKKEVGLEDKYNVIRKVPKIEGTAPISVLTHSDSSSDTNIEQSNQNLPEPNDLSMIPFSAGGVLPGLEATRIDRITENGPVIYRVKYKDGLTCVVLYTTKSISCIWENPTQQ
ncbi:MAG: hypothetical protein OEY59_04985 [Deltaproteobacteria bacterium]|nr:hypothetical protein [Deltaproteobacteria bacterium]